MNIKLTRFLLSFIVLLTFAAGAHAQALTWGTDAVHTAAYFQIRHNNVTNVRGLFKKTNASVTYDPADPSKTVISATIDAASLDTGVEPRDKDLREANYFNVEKFPTITFKSKRVVAAGAGKMKVTGDLTIRDVTKEVTLDVDGPTPIVKDDKGNSFMGASGLLTINRKDFGITINPQLADNVLIDIELAMVRRPPAAGSN